MPYANFNQTNCVVIVGGGNVSINGSASQPPRSSQSGLLGLVRTILRALACIGDVIRGA